MLNSKNKQEEEEDLLTMQRVNISDEEILSMIIRLNSDVID